MEHASYQNMGDILDVIRTTDAENLLDIDSLADLLDGWNDEAHVPQSGHAIIDTKANDALVKQHHTSSGGTVESYHDHHRDSTSGPQALSRAVTAHTSREGNVPRDRKKRTRNQDQMEHNRVAQQKYRERKKLENRDLQHAVDMLTAELATMKALEVRAAELEAHNAGLAQEVGMQMHQIRHLEDKAAEQEATIASQANQISGQLALLTSQQKMILDQHQRLQLQEEIIATLKNRLKESVDAAWDQLSETDPATVCRKMHEAVRAALHGAKDVEGLQETLAQVPDHIVVEICKNILSACRDMWPQLATRLNLTGPMPSQLRKCCWLPGLTAKWCTGTLFVGIALGPGLCAGLGVGLHDV